VSGCQAALEEERRRLASQPRLAARRQFTPTVMGRRLADVVGSPRQPPSTAPGRWPERRSASSGALVVRGGGERASSLRRIDYRQFSPDINGSTPRRRAFIPEKIDHVKTEH